MIIRAPGVTEAGTTSHAPVVSMDFFPTILELAGLPARADVALDGVSLVPMLKGDDSFKQRTLFWHYPHYHGSTWTPGASIRDGDWKLIQFYEQDKVELYHLGDDPGEMRELSAENSDKTNELLEKLHQWQLDLGARVPQPNPEYAPGE